jgi:putative membrane protein
VIYINDRTRRRCHGSADRSGEIAMSRKAVLGIGAGLAASLPLLAQAQPERYGPGMMWDPSWGWFHMVFGPLMMLVWIALLVAVVVLIVRWVGGWGGPGVGGGIGGGPRERTPLDILKERFARGEIDKAEFEERRRTLGE